MRRNVLIVMLVLLVAALAVSSASADPPPPDKPDCTKIQDGVIMYSAGHYLEGQPLTTGYDPFGYNYQAHMFNGSYANVYLGGAGYPPYTGDDASYLAENPTASTHWAWPYRDVNLVMKWDEDWLANVDCDGDGKLDRHYGSPSYIGSGAWETNHMWGSYDEDGKTCTWDYFTKIIAVPADATLSGGIWYSADGTEIGPSIWGQFATIQTVENDPCAGLHGISYSSPDHSGFGGW
jgi:hypothetical protein